ncbi:MAG: sensor histidine kinase, partial [Nocardioidaceae bacterium]
MAIAFADTSISYLALQGREAAGSGLELGWTFGYMLLGLAALTPVGEDAVGRDTSDDRADPGARARELLPYVPVGVVLVVVLATPSLLTDAALVRLLVLMVALIVVRHMLTLADNVELTRSLEERVRRRTVELQRLTRRHQLILDGAGEGIVGLDGLGRVTFANRAAAGLLGRGADELAGQVLHDMALLRGADGDPVSDAADPVTGALSDAMVRTMTDGTYQRADGVALPVELTVAPVHGEDDITRAVLMFRDVTERRAVDRMKDEFVSVVSHELRTPLTSVRGALGLLAGGLLREAPPKAQQMIGIAVESTDRLVRLINDILDAERIAAGRLALHRQVWPAAELITGAVKEMRGLAAESEVLLELSGATGDVDADADRVTQTLTNL